MGETSDGCRQMISAFKSLKKNVSFAAGLGDFEERDRVDPAL